ncbi:MFS general substrate transporter [Venturia nashicola]|nr:MFS general substrate transporter [Venturia nashicola]
MSAKFCAYFDIESGPAAVRDPPAIYRKDGFPAPSPLELDEIVWGGKCSGLPTPTQSGTQTPYPETPQAINEFTISRPPTPKREEAAGLVQRWNNPAQNRWRVLACCLIYFGNGMSDSGPGALIPYMQEDYNIKYAIVSLIFVTQAVGFIVAAFFTDALLNRLGRSKALMLAEVLLIIGNVMIVCTPPFPVVVVAFAFIGYATAINLALNNVFCSTLANAAVVLGIAHGAYGVGGVAGPIIATALVSHGLVWSRYYFFTLGIRVVCCGFAGWAFWGHEKEAPVRLINALEQTVSRQAVETGEPGKRELLAQALRNRVTLMGALSTFAYQGAEVSISGWVISFLISYRHGDPAQVGYVTAGFWGGITVGRFTLSHLSYRIGEMRFLYGLGIGASAFQLLVWLVPNVIGDAVAVGIVGLLLGPVAPCSTVIFVRLLPRRLQTTGVSFISSAGSSGGAVVPLLTGLLAQVSGTWVLHPICISFFVLMLLCWLALPSVNKREE